MIRFKCPQCEITIPCDNTHTDRRILCPSCNRRLCVPSLDARLSCEAMDSLPEGLASLEDGPSTEFVYYRPPLRAGSVWALLWNNKPLLAAALLGLVLLVGVLIVSQCYR